MRSLQNPRFILFLLVVLGGSSLPPALAAETTELITIGDSNAAARPAHTPPGLGAPATAPSVSSPRHPSTAAAKAVSPSAPARLELEKLARTGDPGAQFSLGQALLKGDFGAAEPNEAVRWFTVAAQKHHPAAMTQLGRMLREGTVLRANPFEAAGWFRAASEAGYRSAQVELGLLYYEGRGVHLDWIEAYALLSGASSTIELAPPEEFVPARKALQDLETLLSPEQKALVQQRMDEVRDQSLASMMRRHPGRPKKSPAKSGR